MRWFVLFLLCLSSTLMAQLPDSIENQLTKLDKQAQLIYLDSAADRTLRTNIEQHLDFARKGLLLSQQLKEDSLYHHFLIKVATNYVYQNQFDTARIIYNKVLKEAASDYQKAVTYSEIGVSYYYESNDAEALQNFIRSYKAFEVLGNKEKIAGITNNIGAIYRYLGDYEAAITYLKKAVYYKRLLNKPTTLASSLHNLGISYDNLGQRDSALHYLREARFLREKYQDLRGLAKTYSSMGILYNAENQLDSSEYFFKKAIAISKQAKDLVALSADQISLAEVLTNLSRYRESANLLTDALENTKDARSQINALSFLATNYDKMGSFEKASLTKDRLLHLKDSVNKAREEASLKELQVEFDTEQKVLEIAKLSAENEVQQLRAEQDAQTRVLLVIGLIALTVIALLLYARFRTKSKTNRLLDEKNQELAEINRTKDRLFSIISHDLKSPLSSFHLITQNLASNLDQLDKSQLKEYLESLRDSSENVRDMMDNLLKWALAQTDQLGYKLEPVELSTVLNNVVGQLDVVSKSRSVSIHTNLKEDLKLEGDASFLEIVVRNLLSNSLKFTDPGKSITVESRDDGGKAILRVSDEGVGMEQHEIDKLLAGEIIGAEIQNSAEKGTGLGITLVNELMKKMNGHVQVTTAKGKGTTFTLSFNKAA
ncbi:MAG: tetratricopeptide repeat protein [Bacteroidota bacterium]